MFRFGDWRVLHPKANCNFPASLGSANVWFELDIIDSVVPLPLSKSVKKEMGMVPGLCKHTVSMFESGVALKQPLEDIIRFF